MTYRSVFEEDETVYALDSVGENIFIADKEHRLVWMNQYAQNLIDDIAADLHIGGHQDLIGHNIGRFHRDPQHQARILRNGPFPHRAQIKLGKYTARIIVTEYRNKEKEVKGYILIWQDVTKEEAQKKEEQKRFMLG
ncbi:PAS domain-containing protein [Aneurinibacillus tyrosinisolvens]|uniref:PAS domain-containing protein n=1 Tax=Aneurinibacillus tyrosinisolvens TaxID=1443435 RepID=UPI00063F11B3|nr:PAS domain-containing protein [Aneurinibacillus tyrosinisolvens]